MPGSWSTLRWVSGDLEKPQVPLVLCLFSSLHRVQVGGTVSHLRGRDAEMRPHLAAWS